MTNKINKDRDLMEKRKCKHEFRQKLVRDYPSLRHEGYYCIYCLLEIKDKEELITLTSKKIK